MSPEILAAIPFFTLLVASTVIHLRLMRRLRAQHQQLWLNLGKPHILFNSIDTTLQVRRFLRHEVNSVDDRLLRKLALLDRIVGWCYLLAFVVFVAVLFSRARAGHEPVFPIQIGSPTGSDLPAANGLALAVCDLSPNPAAPRARFACR